ncbi:glucosaminidase domain-containing protein [Candidatus Gottesmanbacteria bacterium]|nr:glucosaminidase domain-containing protein [Candidatus Gottesmanbacteria bacterium]
MIRKFLLVSLWFPLTFAVLIFNLTLLAVMERAHTSVTPLSAVPLMDTSYQVAASSGTGRVLGATIIAADARALLLESFLRQQNSPLSPYADLIVQRSDEKGIDFRLVVAIAMCESNAGKFMPTKNSFNAWGIAVYTGQLTGASFGSWPEAIDWVTTYIRQNYYDQGLIDLKSIGAKWAPPSVATGYSWTSCVEEFQKSIL